MARMPYRMEKRLRARKRARVERRRDAAHAGRTEPPVLCNSIQKAGTHLLVGIVAELPGFDSYGSKAYWHHFNRAAAGRQPVGTLDTVRANLSLCRRGEVMRGHIGYDPAIAAYLRERDVRHLLIVRDPRDIVVSLFHWWSARADVDAWPYRYFASLGDDRARLEFLIDGWPAQVPEGFPADVDYPDLGARVGEYLGWVEDPDCLVVRYEDLTGERYEEAYAAVARHVSPDIDVETALVDMRRGADPSRSKTFRAGGSGRWREAVPADLVPRLEEVVAPVLGPFGYR